MSFISFFSDLPEILDETNHPLTDEESAALDVFLARGRKIFSPSDENLCRVAKEAARNPHRKIALFMVSLVVGADKQQLSWQPDTNKAIFEAGKALAIPDKEEQLIEMSEYNEFCSLRKVSFRLAGCALMDIALRRDRSLADVNFTKEIGRCVALEPERIVRDKYLGILLDHTGPSP